MAGTAYSDRKIKGGEPEPADGVGDLPASRRTDGRAAPSLHPEARLH